MRSLIKLNDVDNNFCDNMNGLKYLCLVILTLILAITEKQALLREIVKYLTSSKSRRHQMHLVFCKRKVLNTIVKIEFALIEMCCSSEDISKTISECM